MLVELSTSCGAVRKLDDSGTKSSLSGSPVGNSRPTLRTRGEQFGIGIAEEVDGLHGIADDEDCAAFRLGPRGHERTDQLVLAAAGVLKLIQQ